MIRISKKWDNYLIVIGCVLSSLFFIYISSVTFQRWQIDTTSERLYSLDATTLKILKELPGTVKLKLFYSKTAANRGSEGIRVFNNYFRYISELLKEYVYRSNNKIELTIIDPRPDTEEEEDAMYYGLTKFDISQTERYFFGLVAISETGTEKVINFFDPNQQEKLEYDLTKLIYSTVNSNKNRIGILSPLRVYSPEDVEGVSRRNMDVNNRPYMRSWIFVRMLQELHDVRRIEEEIDKIEGIDLLMIIHPHSLSNKTMFAIDQYLLNGGKILLFVDPMFFIGKQTLSNEQGGTVVNSQLSLLMDKWGVRMPLNTYAGDKDLAQEGRMATGSNMYAPIAKLLPFLRCETGECTTRFKNAISAGINSLLFAYPGTLQIIEEFKESKELVFTPIVGTTEKGNSYIAQLESLEHPELLMATFREGSGVVMGYNITGNFETAFPKGYEKMELATKSVKPGSVTVFSDVDFIADMAAFQVTPFGVMPNNQNAALAMNAAESLLNSAELFKIRTKGKFTRPFTTIEEIVATAEAGSEEKIKDINNRIGTYTAELDAIMRSGQNSFSDFQAQQNTKRKELNKQIAQMRKELRDVKREGRESIENLGFLLQLINTLLMPIIIIFIGLGLRLRRRG